jgi:hypothetical protein
LKIEEILSARQRTHGSFESVAETAQALKAIIHHAPVMDRVRFGGDTMPPHHLEALDLICTKIARICHGDCYLPDHWLDIQGYAMLVSLKEENDAMLASLKDEND